MTKAERQALWETRITEYKKSGQSVREWCATHEDVNPKQLWYWLRKYKDQDAVSPGNSNRWLPVEITEQASIEQDYGLLVNVGPVSIEVKPGFDPALLSQVVKVLVALC
ncbi:IS66 family insertion sequence element accessory protein TnpA [Moorella sp. ACPs]|uniref:IS66 family insertion sequence element accessory protein TnpA n=1 Tax=Neomoorella carbonis TaxID=3062783 RepID=UPI003873AE91